MPTSVETFIALSFMNGPLLDKLQKKLFSFREPFPSSTIKIHYMQSYMHYKWYIGVALCSSVVILYDGHKSYIFLYLLENFTALPQISLFNIVYKYNVDWVHFVPVKIQSSIVSISISIIYGVFISFDKSNCWKLRKKLE